MDGVVLAYVKEQGGRKLRKVCKQRTVYCVSVTTSKVACRSRGKERNVECANMKNFPVWYVFYFQTCAYLKMYRVQFVSIFLHFRHKSVYFCKQFSLLDFVCSVSVRYRIFYASLRRGSKSFCPMSQLCGM
jgi:hypothetical protein